MWAWLVRLFGVRPVPPEIQRAMTTVKAAQDAAHDAHRAANAYWREVQRVDQIVDRRKP